MVVITVVVIFYTFFNSFHVESELLLQTAVAPLAVQQAIVNSLLWPLGRDKRFMSSMDKCCGPLGVTTHAGSNRIFLTASHLKALSLPRAKHASLGKACKNILPTSHGGGLTNENQTCFFGKACKNILPTSCEVIGMSYLSSCVRGKRKRQGQASLYLSCNKMWGHGATHIKDTTTIAGALALVQPYHSRRECWGGLLPVAGHSASCNECTEHHWQRLLPVSESEGMMPHA